MEEAISHTHLTFFGHVGTTKNAPAEMAMVRSPSRMKILMEVYENEGELCDEEHVPLPSAFTPYAIHLPNGISKDT
jgi:hypothetical protein